MPQSRLLSRYHRDGFCLGQSDCFLFPIAANKFRKLRRLPGVRHNKTEASSGIERQRYRLGFSVIDLNTTGTKYGLVPDSVRN